MRSVRFKTLSMVLAVILVLSMAQGKVISREVNSDDVLFKSEEPVKRLKKNKWN